MLNRKLDGTIMQQTSQSGAPLVTSATLKKGRNQSRFCHLTPILDLGHGCLWLVRNHPISRSLTLNVHTFIFSCSFKDTIVGHHWSICVLDILKIEDLFLSYVWVLRGWRLKNCCLIVYVSITCWSHVSSVQNPSLYRDSSIELSWFQIYWLDFSSTD